MTVTLTVKDRFAVLEMLPQTGTIIDMIISRDLAKKVDFVSSDVESFEMRPTDKGIAWNQDKDLGALFELTQVEADLVKRSIDALDKEGKIKAEYLETCLKFRNL